jgi:hypothetical protein
MKPNIKFKMLAQAYLGTLCSALLVGVVNGYISRCRDGSLNLLLTIRNYIHLYQKGFPQ